VPKEMYEVPIGKAVVMQKGKDVTVAANSYMVYAAMEAAEKLGSDGIEAEVLDMRTVKPLDKELLTTSVRKTGRIVIADGGWKTCGVAAEISSLVFEEVFDYLRAPVARVTVPDIPAPASTVLEKIYYPDSGKIVQAVKRTL
jgi:pyruvate/2-oxoglutarate/acetoin dehydrogenase E1 component